MSEGWFLPGWFVYFTEVLQQYRILQSDEGKNRLLQEIACCNLVTRRAWGQLGWEMRQKNSPGCWQPPHSWELFYWTSCVLGTSVFHLGSWLSWLWAAGRWRRTSGIFSVSPGWRRLTSPRLCLRYQYDYAFSPSAEVQTTNIRPAGLLLRAQGVSDSS